MIDKLRSNVVHIITSLNNGGAEAVLYRLVTYDTSNLHTVICLMDMGKYGPMLEKKGIRVICLNIPRGKVSISALLKLWRTLKKLKPDVVQTWMYHVNLAGGVIAKLTGAKRVFWGIHHTNLDPKQTAKSTVLVAKICAQLSSFVPYKIICCAEKAVQVHSELGYNKGKMIVIGNGYQLDQFIPNAETRLQIRNELSLGKDPVLGMVGRFNALKNHKNLLDALGLLKRKGNEFKCLLIGPNMNEENTQITEWIENNNLTENVILLGPRSDIPAVMNALDIHVLSSRSEAFPNVIAEAMACGTPCITTDVGDASVIVADTGWVVPPENFEALALAMEQALNEHVNQPNNWQARKLACRKTIEENFSIEEMVKKYTKAWEI